MRVARAADDRLLAALLVLVAAAVLFFRLGQGPLLDFDEATYAEIAREIGVFHDFVHLHFDFTPWLNKAPLYIWLTGGLFQLFGTSEFWARAVSAAAGAGVVGLTYLLGRTWLDRSAAAGAALLLLLADLFVRAARFGTSDVLLTFWIYLGLYAYVRSRANPRWWYLVGAAWGLGFMTKDIASLVGPAAVGVALVVDGGLRVLRRPPEPYLALALALAIVLPWHVAVYLWQGSAFIQQYVGYMVVTRAQQQIEGHTGGLSYYALWSVIGFYPWAYAAAAGFLQHLLVDVRARRASSATAALTVIVLALYTAVHSKLYWYIDPLFPAYALFAAGGIAWVLRRRGPVELAAVAVIAVVGVLRSPGTVVTPPRSLQLAFAALVVAGALVGLIWARRTAPAVVAAIAAFTVLSALTVAPLYDLPDQPAPSLGAAARLLGGGPLYLYLAGDPIALAQDNIAHSLTFYSHRQVVTVVGADALRAALPCGVSRDVVLDSTDPARPSRSYDFRLQASWFRFQLLTMRAPC